MTLENQTSWCNKAAFPVDEAYSIYGVTTQQDGMTYRQWLIGQIACGLASSHSSSTIFAQKVINFADALIDNM